jgi:hypothetical protein
MQAGGGNVGIGQTTVAAKLGIGQSSTTAYSLIAQTPVVGLTAGDYVNMAYFTNARSTNNDGLRIVNTRDSTAASVGEWEKESYRIRRSVDQNDGFSGVQEEIVFGNQLLAFTTNGTERMRIDSSGYVTNAVNGLGNGRLQAYQYYRLNSAVVGANATGAQSMFGVGVTLVGSTQYEFEIFAILTKTAGATSHTITFSFGGTATLNNILMNASVCDSSTTLPITPSTAAGAASATSSMVITGALAAANRAESFLIKGTVSINAGGTLIPQYTLSAAPGGAYTTQIGSYFKISPLAASGANVNVGSWA